MKKFSQRACLFASFFLIVASTQLAVAQTKPGGKKKLETAIFGGGCFWCTEAVFQEINGVESVRSGYIGGSVKNPTYKQVCSGNTGHAEAIEIKFDPTKVKFETLLEIHFKTHDPTTLNRQGNDIGTQYRSGVFFTSEQQKKAATAVKAKFDKSGTFRSPIVTEIVPSSIFYPAEDYHQNYFKLNPRQGYCGVMIAPKIAKVRKEFKHLLKKPAAEK